MQPFITKIGKGQRGSKDLTWDEAKLAIAALLEHQATPYQAGAFLMAMRIKMESISELAAFTTATRHYIDPIEVPSDLRIVDLPTYGEKHETFHVSIAAAILAAAAGTPVFMHGTDNPTAQSDPGRVLHYLGIPTDLTPKMIAQVLGQFHFAYLDIALYHPPLAQYLDLRKELGVQTLFHQVARMLNPARAQSQVIGISHPPYLEKIAEAVSMLGGHRLLILQGIEGYPELSLSMETTMRELRGGRISPVNMKPTDVGFPISSFREMAAPPANPSIQRAQQEAHLIRQLLNNTIRGHQQEWVLFNAGMLLYAGGKASSILQGVKIAKHHLHSGSASAQLATLSAASPAAHHQQITNAGVSA